MKTAVSLWSVIFGVLTAALGVSAAVIEVSLDYTNWWEVGAAVAAGISAVLGAWALKR
jgi:hypothetical protein